MLTLTPHKFRPKRHPQVDAEWGTLRVPENRDRVDSPSIELALVRFPARTKEPGAPIVFLAGGPGESGIAAASGSLFPLFQRLRDVADVIALDQRGCGYSRPALALGSGWQLPDDVPGSRESWLRAGCEHAARAELELGAHGVDARAYHTLASADDLDTLRVALGAHKLNLWAISYGTHLAMHYLARHGHVDRAVFGGPEGFDHTFKLPQVVDSFLDTFSEHVATQTEWGVLGFDLREQLVSVARALDDKALSVPVQVDNTVRSIALSGFDLRRIVASGLADTRFLSALPSVLFALARRDDTTLGREALFGRYLINARDGIARNAMAVCMDCASGASADRLARIAEEARGSIVGSLIDFPFPQICDIWGVRAMAPPKVKRTEASVLVLSGSLDARTPVDNVADVERLASTSVVIVEGAGHADIFFSSSRAQDLVVEHFGGEQFAEVDGETVVTVDAPIAIVPPPDTLPFKPVLLFDGKCGFCKAHVARWRAASRAVAMLPYQSAGKRPYGISRDDLRVKVHLVEPDGTIYTGAAAIFRTVFHQGSKFRWWCYRNLPGFAAISELLYRYVATNRRKVPSWIRWV